MKKLKLLKALLIPIAIGTLSIINCEATVLTVSNLGGSQYTSLDAAIGGASAGDTLFIKNTNIDYQIADCDPAWSKSLVVIGAGFNPNTTSPKLVRFGYYNVCNFSNSNDKFGIGGGGNGSKFIGIEFAPELINTSSISSYSFENCSFLGLINFDYFSVYSVSFKNCVFKFSNADNIRFSGSAPTQNIAFTNCIFNGTVTANNNIASTITIDHCIFLSTSVSPLNAIQFTSIQNSVFMNYAGFSASVSNCIFNNNIARLTSTMPPSGNSGSGNIVSSDPLFLNYTLGNLYSASDNYSLQASSPAIGAGIGGTDIGIHNSTSTFNETGEPTNVPVIRDMTLQNVTVPQNGNVNVKVRSTKARTN